MNRLIGALEGFFTAATLSGGELAKTAKFTLENVNWARKLSKPDAMQTNEQPLLAVWLWTSHLDSEVVIVRG